MLVKMSNGSEVDFDVAVSFMDDDLREHVHNAYCPQDEQEFLSIYEFLHYVRFGVSFEVN